MRSGALSGFISGNVLNDRCHACMAFTFVDFTIDFPDKHRFEIWKFFAKFFNTHEHINIFGASCVSG